MRTYKVAIVETWIGGTKPERILEVKARSSQSAVKKARVIQGNRDWEITSVEWSEYGQTIKAIGAGGN